MPLVLNLYQSERHVKKPCTQLLIQYIIIINFKKTIQFGYRLLHIALLSLFFYVLFDTVG